MTLADNQPEGKVVQSPLERLKTARQALRTRARARLKEAPKEAVFAGILLLSCAASFVLGMLTGRGLGQGNAFSVEEVPLQNIPTATAAAGQTLAPAALPTAGGVVASKGGTKYYFPWCGGASRISAANLITFASEADAQAQGYQLAANCTK